MSEARTAKHWDVVPVILAGGSGSRLWPLSRELRPKQFHRLLGKQSLVQQTLLRAQRVCQHKPLIVCNQEHRFLVAEQCREIGVEWSQIILEPQARNTAPAIGLAALAAKNISESAVMLVLPSDHLIEDEAAFADAVGIGASAASNGALVTFGVTPDRPETGYGYIKAVGDVLGCAHDVEAFVEKPDSATAAQYFKQGNYLWNSGMFVLGADSYLSELSRYQPKILESVTASMVDGVDDLDFFRPSEAFCDSPADSIDYAVMERTARAAVVPVNFGWSDVGAWSAVWEASGKDADGNCTHGDVITLDTKDSYVFANDRLVSTVGLEDTVVIETSDAVLVAAKDSVQDVKVLVERLKADNREEYHNHRKVFRPWGSYESVGTGQRYQVKHICVYPGASLSLQMHYHRAEHWIVVRGTAEVTRGEETFPLAENESTYIPLGVRHRLVNPGKLTLELIEVQMGSYLGEDDIVRFEDVYGR